MFVCVTTGYNVPSHNLFLGRLVCLWLVNHASFHTHCQSLFTPTPPHVLLSLSVYLTQQEHGRSLHMLGHSLHQRTSLSEYACDHQQSHSFTLLGEYILFNMMDKDIT